MYRGRVTVYKLNSATWPGKVPSVREEVSLILRGPGFLTLFDTSTMIFLSFSNGPHAKLLDIDKVLKFHVIRGKRGFP